MTPDATDQLPPLPDHEPAPHESQAEFEQRTGQAQTDRDATAEQTAPSAPAPQEAAPAEQELEITHSEPLLATGATGEAVTRLVGLLEKAGYANNNVIQAIGAHPILDDTVMQDVRAFWSAHPEAQESDELFAGRTAGVHELQGSWVGPRTWQVLYDLAGQAS